jgi:hypothetical protein
MNTFKLCSIATAILVLSSLGLFILAMRAHAPTASVLSFFALMSFAFLSYVHDRRTNR